MEWRDFCREINMEDAIKPDSESIVVSTMHKSKGKEYDHVLMLLENYDYSTDESRRLLYVASTRAKKTLHIHTNSSFYDQFESKKIMKSIYSGELSEPMEYEIILSHKDINLSNFKYHKSQSILKTIKTGDNLEKSNRYSNGNEVLGLGVKSNECLFLFSRRFISEHFEPMQKKGYDIKEANAEYILYWYDKNDDKEYQIVLPKLKMDKVK